MAQTLAWWVVVQVMALAALPIALTLFRRLPDHGYAFSKPLGVLLTGYVFWIALSLKLLPNRPGSVVWALVIVAVAAAAIAWPRRQAIIDALKERWRVVVAVEGLFFVALFTAAHLRSFIPEIAGTEKPMDFMFLNAVDRSHNYPPADPWFAGASVSYYYFGYVLQAMIGKLAFQPTEITFNLGLVGTAALAAIAAFGLGYNLTALLRRGADYLPFIAGGVAVVLVVILGNLEGVLEFMAANGIGSGGFYESMGIAGLPQAGESSTFYPTEQSSFWWWWRATRIHPEAAVIMEFPFFSFLLGDLHPHVMAIPFVLTAVGYAVALWLSEEPLTADSWVGNPALLVIAAVLLGSLTFLNAWDLPTFAFIVALLVVLRNRQSLPWRESVLATAGWLFPLAALGFVLYLPFYMEFSSQAAGLRADESVGTRPLHAALFWAPLYVLALPAPVLVLSRYWRSIPRLHVNLATAFFGGLVVLWVLLVATDGSGRLNDAIAERGFNWLTTLFLALAVAVSGLSLFRLVDDEDERASPLVPALALTTTAMLLVLGAELFFIQDVFNSRLNTVFKLYYQAWLLLGVAGAFSILWLALEWRPAARSAGEALRGAWAMAAVLVVAGAMLYPLGATLSRTNGLSSEARTLDGLAFASRHSPDDYAAAMWLRNAAERNEVVLEAVGGPYSAYGRVSGWTGVPTVLGWGAHEVQWGRPGEAVARRQGDIDRAYTTESLEEALSILQQYGVTYVFVGSLERAKYPASGLAKFDGNLPVAHRTGVAIIYRMPATVGPADRTPPGAAGR